MKHFKKFYINTNFFKPKHLVWQDRATQTPEISEPGNEELTMASFGEILKTSEFVSQSQEVCDSAKGEGRAVVEQHVCSLRGMEKYQEIVHLRQFIDELGEKFLNTLEGYKGIRDSFKRFQVLQEVVDMEAVMKRFKKAESYKIIPFRAGKNPAEIIFTYADGATEAYTLELSQKEKVSTAWKGLSSILEGVDERRGDVEYEEFQKGSDLIKEGVNISTGLKEGLERLEVIFEQRHAKAEEMISRANYLNTPETAYSELKNITAVMPEDFLVELSEPLSKIADIWSNSEVNYDDYGERIKMQEGDDEQYHTLLEEATSILKEHFGDIHKLSSEELDDIEIIEKTFGLG